MYIYVVIVLLYKFFIAIYFIVFLFCFFRMSPVSVNINCIFSLFKSVGL